MCFSLLNDTIQDCDLEIKEIFEEKMLGKSTSMTPYGDESTDVREMENLLMDF